MKFSVSQIYPCSRVELGSELFYLCELGKYLQCNGHVLSLDGVTFSPVLLKSRYWSYLQVAYTNGWVVDMPKLFKESPTPVVLSDVRNILIVEEEVSWDEEDFKKRKDDEEYNTYTPQRKQVIFTQKNDQVWEFSNSDVSIENSVNLRSLKNDLVSQSWVSLVAYVAINRLLTDIPKALSLVIPLDYTMCSLSFADMTLLIEETDALNGWCFADVGSDNRFSYEGWWFKQYDRGHLSRYCTPKEKQAEFKKLGFYEGDVVFLYTRDKCQVLNRVKLVTSCNFAIVKEVNKMGIVFDVFFTRNTRFGEALKFQSFPAELKNLYFSDSYMNCRHSTKAIPWEDLGVEYVLFDEEYFISSIEKNDVLEIQDSYNLTEVSLTLDCVNAIYWLLKDYDIEFDDEAYRKKYFKGAKPMWDMFKDGTLM